MNGGLFYFLGELIELIIQWYWMKTDKRTRLIIANSI